MTKKERRKRIIYPTLLMLCLLLVSCQTDSYEKGEGEYSLLQADFAELYVDGQKQGVSFTTDEGATIQLTPPYTAKWIETADTTYRTIVYYSLSANGATPSANSPATAQAEAIGAVVTMHPVPQWKFKNLPQDPIGVESVWLSRNGKYLNLSLLVKTGRVSDEELPHNIGLAQDTVYIRDDGRRTAYWRLLHSQNGIPQYYTNRRYASVALPTNAPDTICLTIPTFEGPQQRTVTINNKR